MHQIIELKIGFDPIYGCLAGEPTAGKGFIIDYVY